MTISHEDYHDGKSIVDEKRNPSNQELENSSTGYGLETVTIKKEKHDQKSPNCGGL